MLRYWIARHAEETGSPRANWILDNWESCCPSSSKSSRTNTSACWASQRQKSAVAWKATWVKVTGFMEYARELPERRPVAERVNDWFEIYKDVPARESPDAGRPLHGLRRARSATPAVR